MEKHLPNAAEQYRIFDSNNIPNLTQDEADDLHYL